MRVLIPRLIFDTAPAPFATMDMLILAGSALAVLVHGLLSGASPGRFAMRLDVSKGYALTAATHLGWMLLVTTVIAGWIVTGMDPVALFSEGGLAGARRIFTALLTPEWDILGDALLAMVETIYLAFMATAIAVPFSFLLSFYSARNLMSDTIGRRVMYIVLRFLTNFSRSIEPLIWAIVFSVWVGIGPFAGMLALVVHTIASLTKQYAEQIEDVDHGPIEAITATGASRTQVIWFSVVPQCVIPFLSFTIYRWDINVRMATVIGLVGGGGIGNMLIQYQGLAQWNEVGAIVIIIAIVVWIMDVISARVREALK
ncbi:MAG: phosphonate ABC transporter, permease protein PhnE [Candidatus Kapabacteria bacterium]|nr:phosphonate ABC transporter, permease protein PhnE [Candidatus Kapabacteria bacterium]